MILTIRLLIFRLGYWKPSFDLRCRWSSGCADIDVAALITLHVSGVKVEHHLMITIVSGINTVSIVSVRYVVVADISLWNIVNTTVGMSDLVVRTS